MDEIVKAALAKWPNVPHCYGWLALDARGHWFMRDERTQAAGPFPQVKGSRIEHEKLLAFIHRNYERDEEGAWFFQNGPQRVYVELEAAPWVWRLHGPTGTQAEAGPQITSHTGKIAEFQAAWLDESGRLFLRTNLGLGLVHSLDMAQAAEAIEHGRWPLQESTWAELMAHPQTCLSPAAVQARKNPQRQSGGAG
jgi:hypothetical protein